MSEKLGTPCVWLIGRKLWLRQQLFLCASFRLGKYGTRMCGLRPLSIRWGGDGGTLSIVWLEACVLALFYWHGARRYTLCIN